MNNNGTIVAISTGVGAGAISIVRMSGDRAVEIADKIFSSNGGKLPSSFVPRMLVLGSISTKNFTEQAMCVKFAAPKSYTGEDMIEFQCHGGTQIASGILKECLSQGARLATNGEFTKRAFLNGKITLSAAEGMMDMINAESDAEIRAGYGLLSGNLSSLATFVQNKLTDILAEIEVSFDYPEETIEFITKSKVKNELTQIRDKIQEVLKTSNAGKLIKSGLNVLIVGRPNVGKSSLLNNLLGQEKAIVTDVAGTTRDVIEGSFLLGDIKINLIDTAGIQETNDKVEKIGIDKAKSLISFADIVLFLIDQSKPYGDEDEKIHDEIKGTNFIAIKTKSDLSPMCEKHFEGEIAISNRSKDGIDKIKEKLSSIAQVSNADSGKIIITNERHKISLSHALQSIENALAALSENSLDLISIDIKDAYTSIGEITGNTASEDIIDAIFKKFCLGK